MEKETIMIERRLTFLMVPLILAFLLSGCERSDGNKLKGKELVKINNVSISLDEFRQISEQQPLEGKMKLLNEKGLREFLESYVVTREVLFQEAKKKGLDKNKEIKQKVEDFQRAMIIDALLEEVLRTKGEVTENEILKYYKENEDRFTEPLEVKIRHIFVASEPVLEEVLAGLSKGESFEKLASTYNIDRTREDGGNLGYIRRGQLSPTFSQFEEAAFSLRKKGDRSEVIKTPYGYHILQLEDKRGKVLRPYDQVKEKIRFYLQGKKKQDAYLEYVKEAKSKAKVIVNDKLWNQEVAKQFKVDEKKDEKKGGKAEEKKETKPEKEKR